MSGEVELIFLSDLVVLAVMASFNSLFFDSVDFTARTIVIGDCLSFTEAAELHLNSSVHIFAPEFLH